MKRKKFSFSLQSGVTILALLISLSCDFSEEGDEWTCILNCNPDDCLKLDEEECECVPDTDCLRVIFCDGDVQDCDCKEEDGGSWCSALTGDSIKTWKISYVYNHFRGDTIEPSFLWWWDGEFSHIYRIDHIFIRFFPDENDQEVYNWEFDDVHSPTKIIYSYKYSNPTEVRHLTDYEARITKLNPDTLVFTRPVEGLPGDSDIVYVPL